MKTRKFISIIVFFLLIVSCIPLFLSKLANEARQDYFEGKVLENMNNSIVVQIAASYEDLISQLGETVQIEKKDIVKECDYSIFPPGEDIRVLYTGIDSKNQKLEHIFAIYTLSEIQ